MKKTPSVGFRFESNIRAKSTKTVVRLETVTSVEDSLRIVSRNQQ